MWHEGSVPQIPSCRRPEILRDNKNLMDYGGQPGFKYGFTVNHFPALRPVEDSDAIWYGAGVGGVVKIW